MQNSKMLTRTILRTPVLGEMEVLFPFSEIVSTLSYCTAMQNSKIHPGTKPRPTYLRFRGEESLFSFSENEPINSPTVMPNSKIFWGTISWTFVLGERNVCFHSPKMYQNSPTAMQNTKIFPGTILQIPVLWRGKYFLVLQNVPKLSYSNS